MRRINLTSAKDVANLIKLIDKLGLTVIRCGKGQKYPSFDIARKSKEYTSLAGCMIVEEKETKLEITTKYFLYKGRMGPATYVFSLNEENLATLSGQKAFAEMSRADNVSEMLQNLLD